METNKGLMERDSENSLVQKLSNDLKAVARDAEELLRATANDLSEKTKEVRARLGATLEAAKDTCKKLEATAVEGAKATDRVIREYPYPALGAAFGLGLILGVLLKRR